MIKIKTKTTFNRITYYTRKIIQFSSYSTYLLDEPEWYKNRFNRLATYKTELHRRIDLEGKDKWWTLENGDDEDV